jgi:hypothetical protein
MFSKEESDNLIKLGKLLMTVAQDTKINHLNKWDTVKYKYLTDLIDQSIDVGFELANLEDSDDSDDTDIQAEDGEEE